jgi:Asp-tRNA(Asn)/Glu-tRNA(Gln) amidotransferase A subunit family amidase
MESIAYTSASDLVGQIRGGSLSPVEVVDTCIENIEERNEDTNAFVTVLDEEARQRAREAERAIKEGQDLGPLHGVPVALKDGFNFKAGVRSTLGSMVFDEFVPEKTAEPIRRLEAAGAIVVGQTNVPEFGHKATTDNRLFGATSTPFDLDRNSGGSSGGSAAAVADGLVPIAEGTDVGGSVRIPAAACGVVGYKPTFGRIPEVSRPNAFIAHTPFLHTGPITRTVKDAALALDVMAGPHPRDPLCLPESDSDFVGAVEQGIENWSVAYSPDLDVFPVEERVSRVVERSLAGFNDAGAVVEEVEVGIDIPQKELSAMLNRQVGGQIQSTVEGFKMEGIDLLGEHRNELCERLVSVIEATRERTIVEHQRDEFLRTDVFDAIQDVFESHDLLVTPTLTVPPVENEKDGQTVGPTTVNGEEVDPLIGWCLTYPLNYTGHPAVSVPAGFTDDGLPVGLQIVGQRFDDEAVLAAAAAFERTRPWHDAYPPR